MTEELLNKTEAILPSVKVLSVDFKESWHVLRTVETVAKSMQIRGVSIAFGVIFHLV